MAQTPVPCFPSEGGGNRVYWTSAYALQEYDKRSWCKYASKNWEHCVKRTQFGGDHAKLFFSCSATSARVIQVHELGLTKYTWTELSVKPVKIHLGGRVTQYKKSLTGEAQRAVSECVLMFR